MECDVVVVGGGIAGSALAVTLARESLDVVVLERQQTYHDRVRGESLWPWGVAEARRLGLHDVLLEAADGDHIGELVDYGDGDDPDGAEAHPIPLSLLVDGVPGALNLAHPTACGALAAAAASSGAAIVRGPMRIEVTPGRRPVVDYTMEGVARRVTCRLVVGADGRASRVRRQAGIRLQRAAETHMIAGLLVDNLHIEPDRDVAAVGDDVFMVTLPQGAGRARVYLCFGLGNRQRFAGPGSAERFIRSSSLPNLPKGEAWARAVPAGPCRAYPADDTWTERPFTDGVVLIGDAGGYNNPLIGQGLALALRDVRALRELLADGGTWDTAALAHYGSARAERLRRMRFIAGLYATESTTFGPEGRELRRGVRQRLSEDPALQAGPLAMFTGPDELGPGVCTESFRRRYFGADA
jgi:2-polyprenyl-6-methoxyphenol hydroxylase-like FAD-dependent oxidoreductase